MVANLPYNVATPLVVGVLETAPMIERMLVMVQREVGERLAAGAGDDAYGAVSVKVAYYATRDGGRHGVAERLRPEAQRRERAGALRAPRRSRRCRCPTSTAMFELVRAGFATRRKTLRNTLQGRIDAERFARAERRSAGARRDALARRLGEARRMPDVEESRVDAFAKLTLSLHITGTRADGYHELDATMVSISEPHDSLVHHARPTRRR